MALISRDFLTVVALKDIQNVARNQGPVVRSPFSLNG